MANFRNTLPSNLQAEIEKLGRLQITERDERLLFQGEPAEQIGYILSGRAKAVSFSVDGVETWLGHFEPGEFFGHTAFLTDSPVRFEVSAEDTMRLRLIPANEIRALLDLSLIHI